MVYNGGIHYTGMFPGEVSTLKPDSKRLVYETIEEEKYLDTYGDSEMFRL